MVELRVDSVGEPRHPLENAPTPDRLGLTIVDNYVQDIAYERIGDRNRVTMRLKQA
jgi:hypothetical protein